MDLQHYPSYALPEAPASRSRLPATPFWSFVTLFGALFIGYQVVMGGSMVRVTVAVVAMIALAIPALEHPKNAVTALFIVLPFMGTIRHAFLSATGVAALDPLLLITSSVAITILFALALSDRLDLEGTPASKVIFLLLCIGILQVFNPGQGGLLVGLTGVMINLIPISFFFIARSISDHQMTTRIIRIVMIIGGLAALYGLSQVFIGFRGFEKTWLARQGYNAATVGETTRPFSFFNNAAEYAAYAQIAFVAVFATLMFAAKGTKKIWYLGLSGLIVYAGFLIGSRGFTVKVGVALIALLAVRAKNRLLSLGLVILLSGAAVIWSATTTTDTRIQDQQQGAAQLIDQQIRALADPFDRTKSTLPIHWESATRGIWFAATKQPAGLGTGVATRGGAKFGGIQAGTEFDIGDAFLAFGIPGGVLYLLAIMFGLVEASRVRRALPGPVWAAIWAIGLSSIGAWLLGGNYAVAPLIWFLIGAADGQYKRLRQTGLLDERGRVPKQKPDFGFASA
ncbi:MAG: hypothetical protein ACLGH3_08725 [Actinomycetota bacterium]